MKKKFLLPSVVCLAMLASCVEKEPGRSDEPAIDDETEYFDFSTEQSVRLTLDYGFGDYRVNFEVYATDPYDEDGVKRTDVQPVYGAFTDSRSQYSGTVKVPAYVTTLYVCSDYVGVPHRLAIDIENGVAAYEYSLPILPGMTATRAGEECISIEGNRSTVSGSKNLYGLYDSFSKYDAASGVTWWAYNSHVANLYQAINNAETNNLVSRINASLPEEDSSNAQYITDAETTNLRIVETTDDGQIVTSAHLDLVYLDAHGDYENAMGYYYYPTGSNPSADEIKALPKFVVYPMTHNGSPDTPVKVRLQFFGENYDEAGTDDFPAGYTVGWILFCNIYNGSLRPTDNWQGGSDFEIGRINSRIEMVYGENNVVYSNSECNNYGNDGCITLTDTETGRVVIGFEDYAFQERCGDKDYNDILFYVEADPATAIYDPDRPVIPDPDPEPTPATYSTVATLGFEDIWPDGGDYDLNDVIVEHTRTVTYLGDYVTSVEDAYKVVNLPGSADYVDAFGFTVDADKVGTIEGYAVKEESNQYIVFEDAQRVIGQTFTVTRTFADGTVSNAGSFDDGLNPFVVSQYVAGAKNRVEIHLPSYEMTSWANTTLANEGHEAYYISPDGKYPFAIRLEGVTGWEPVTPGVRIGSPGEYPRFNNWVADPTTNQDWYLYKD